MKMYTVGIQIGVDNRYSLTLVRVIYLLSYMQPLLATYTALSSTPCSWQVWGGEGEGGRLVDLYQNSYRITGSRKACLPITGIHPPLDSIGSEQYKL